MPHYLFLIDQPPDPLLEGFAQALVYQNSKNKVESDTKIRSLREPECFKDVGKSRVSFIAHGTNGIQIGNVRVGKMGGLRADQIVEIMEKEFPHAKDIFCIDLIGCDIGNTQYLEADEIVTMAKYNFFAQDLAARLGKLGYKADLKVLTNFPKISYLEEMLIEVSYGIRDEVNVDPEVRIYKKYNQNLVDELADLEKKEREETQSVNKLREDLAVLLDSSKCCGFSCLCLNSHREEIARTQQAIEEKNREIAELYKDIQDKTEEINEMREREQHYESKDVFSDLDAMPDLRHFNTFLYYELSEIKKPIEAEDNAYVSALRDWHKNQNDRTSLSAFKKELDYRKRELNKKIDQNLKDKIADWELKRQALNNINQSQDKLAPELREILLSEMGTGWGNKIKERVEKENKQKDFPEVLSLIGNLKNISSKQENSYKLPGKFG